MICLKATQIPNLKSHRVNLLPQLKGTGLVYDSLIAYNLDPEFKALAQEMSTNMPRVATEFSTFLEHYSGYTAYVNELQEKYSIENFQMQEADKQAWIVERFEATDKYTTTINNYYTKNSDGSIAKSGYQALSYYDTNNDGVVDSTDTRFNELSLWIDSNQDGVTDTGELKTLSEMGVTSLTLNSTSPYIPSSENTNTIIEETTFTDANGEGIMRDILFRYENTSKPTEGVYFDMDANGIQEKMTRWTDPNQWMIVKDINNDGVIDASDNSGLAFWTDRNHNGLTDIGELEALGAAGAIQTIKLNIQTDITASFEADKDDIIFEIESGNVLDRVSNYSYTLNDKFEKKVA